MAGSLARRRARRDCRQRRGVGMTQRLSFGADLVELEGMNTPLTRIILPALLGAALCTAAEAAPRGGDPITPPPAPSGDQGGVALGLLIHGGSPAMSQHVQSVIQANVGGLPEVALSANLDAEGADALAELKVRLGSTVERAPGRTQVRCQMTHMIFEVQRRPEGLKRVLKASNRYQAQVDLGAEADPPTAEAEERHCLEALAPLVVTDLQTWMRRAR